MVIKISVNKNKNKTKTKQKQKQKKCVHLCIYITAFASISSTALEIEALSFAVNRFRKKQKNVQNTNKVWCGKLKTESTRKLSNFYFQWGKTLYQNNLTNIAFFFTFFKGLRCNKSSVVTPKKIFHGRQRKWMSNFTRYVISIGNSMICCDIWHKYHEWYFEIVILNFTSR